MKPAAPVPKKAVNWEALRARLSQAIARTEAAARPSPDRIQEILQQRAQGLAQARGGARRVADAVEVVSFRVGNDSFAIATPFVRAVRPLGDWTPVPAGPDFLVGVFNLHGQVVALFDLSRLFGTARPSPETTNPSWLLVLGEERIEFGVVVGGALEVATLGTDELLPPPTVGGPVLRGVTAAALQVLDGEALLHDARLYLDQGDDMHAVSGEAKP
jgi:purine-binding chemotaxis protein CheW